MSDTLTPVSELGFAEFTSGLIYQTLEAILSAYADQERRLAEIRRIAALSSEEYAVEFDTELAVDAVLAQRFPPAKDSTLLSAVHQGASYSPAADGTDEVPAVKALTGYQMVSGRDYRKQNGLYVITAAGYTNIRTSVALEKAGEQLVLIRSMASRGFPRILIDNGKVSSKLVFKVYGASTDSSTVEATGLPGISSRTALKKFMVAPVHAKGPEYLSLKADIVGEVEVTFKTIIE